MQSNIKKAVNECIDRLFDSHCEHLSDKDIKLMPSKNEICEIIDELKKFFFPKYFSQTLSQTKFDCVDKLTKIANKLKKQVELALSYDISQDCAAVSVCSAVSEKGEKLTSIFISRLCEVFELIKLDVKATLDGDPAARNTDIIIIAYPGIDATFTYRLAHILYELNIPLIPRIMTEYAHSKTGIDIHPGATIGKSFVIDHGTGVVIGETTEIGNGVKIYQGVTLGAISLKNADQLVGKKRHPTLKNNVTIYSGATVLGGNTIIGEGAIIGSNTFITKSIEDGVTVAIEKPKLRLYSNDATKYEKDQN